MSNSFRAIPIWLLIWTDRLFIMPLSLYRHHRPHPVPCNCRLLHCSHSFTLLRLPTRPHTKEIELYTPNLRISIFHAVLWVSRCYGQRGRFCRFRAGWLGCADRPTGSTSVSRRFNSSRRDYLTHRLVGFARGCESNRTTPNKGTCDVDTQMED